VTDPDAVVPRPKRTTEKFRIGFDFANDLATDDTIASYTVTAKRLDTDVDVTATFLAAGQSSGTVISVQVLGGTTGVEYDVTFTIVTTAGDTFVRVVRLAVTS
jgi:hypothetical protein